MMPSHISPFTNPIHDIPINRAKRIATFAVSAEEDLEYLEAIRFYSQACSILEEWLETNSIPNETKKIVIEINTKYQNRVNELRQALPTRVQALSMKTDNRKGEYKQQDSTQYLHSSKLNSTRSNGTALSTSKSFQMKTYHGLRTETLRKESSVARPGKEIRQKYGAPYTKVLHLSKVVVGGGFLSQNVYVVKEVWKQEGARINGFLMKLQALRDIAAMRLVHRLEGMPSPIPILEVQTRLHHVVSELSRLQLSLEKPIVASSKQSQGNPEPSDGTQTGSQAQAPPAQTAKDSINGNVFDSLWKDVKSFGQRAQKSASTAIQRINSAASVVVTNAKNLEDYRSVVLEICAQFITYTPIKLELEKQLEMDGITEAQRQNVNEMLLQIDHFYSKEVHRMIVLDIQSLLEQFIYGFQTAYIPNYA